MTAGTVISSPTCYSPTDYIMMILTDLDRGLTYYNLLEWGRRKWQLIDVMTFTSLLQSAETY